MVSKLLSGIYAGIYYIYIYVCTYMYGRIRARELTCRKEGAVERAEAKGDEERGGRRTFRVCLHG